LQSIRLRTSLLWLTAVRFNFKKSPLWKLKSPPKYLKSQNLPHNT